MKGRKPSPSKVVELRGGTKHTHRPEKNTPKPASKIPPCPSHLSKEAKNEWRRMGKELDSLGLLTDLDKAVFAMYCSAWAEWKMAQQDIEAIGMVVRIPVENVTARGVKTSYSKLVANPSIAIKHAAEDRMMKCLVELGMSPSSRSRIKVAPPEKPSAAKAFLHGKTG